MEKVYLNQLSKGDINCWARLNSQISHLKKASGDVVFSKGKSYPCVISNAGDIVNVVVSGVQFHSGPQNKNIAMKYFNFYRKTT